MPQREHAAARVVQYKPQEIDYVASFYNATMELACAENEIDSLKNSIKELKLLLNIHYGKIHD